MKIIIYGAGYYGSKMLQTVKKYPNIKVLGFIDKNKKGEVYGYPILEVDNIQLQDNNISIIIAIADMGQVLKVYRNLKDLGFQNIYYYLHKSYCVLNDFLQNECIKLDNISENTLMYAEMHLIDYCNLNCKGCAHFSALYEKELPDIQKRIEDVKTISKIFDNIVVFNMMGGEPLLNPQIEDYIIEIRKILPKTELQLITNGLLMPKLEDHVLKCIASNHITVGISEYKPTHIIIEQIKRRLEEYHIDYFVREYDKKQRFVKPLSLSEHSIYPHKCLSSGCINIWEGKIAKCPTLMYIGKLNERFSTHFPEEGIINLDKDMKAKELLEKLNELVPLCSHCIECEMQWEVCNGDMNLSCFVTDK